jgi:chemotaxis protein CheX
MEPIDQATVVQFVRAATQDVFTTMLGMQLAEGEAYVERTPPAPAEGVVSLIGMAGQWVGTGCVSCSASTACRIASQMLMTEINSVCEDVLDAVAEVTNMVIGNVKTGLEETLGPMGLSIPTVVFGKNFTTRSAGEGEWTVVPFFQNGERIEVKIFLAPSRKPVPIRCGYVNPGMLQG